MIQGIKTANYGQNYSSNYSPDKYQYRYEEEKRICKNEASIERSRKDDIEASKKAFDLLDSSIGLTKNVITSATNILESLWHVSKDVMMTERVAP